LGKHENGILQGFPLASFSPTLLIFRSSSLSSLLLQAGGVIEQRKKRNRELGGQEGVNLSQKTRNLFSQNTQDK